MIVFFKGTIDNITDPDDIYIRMAYNNDILNVFSNTLTQPDYCDISIGTDITVRLYPNPQGYFTFNFMPYVTSLINTREFEDTLSTSLINGNNNSFYYDFSEGTFLEKQITFKIFQGADTNSASYTFDWLLGVEQISEKTTRYKNRLHILSPFKENSENSHMLRYWRGYPFDISVYSIFNNLYVSNETTALLNEDFNSSGYVKRLFISDGRTEASLEDLLGLSEGYNYLRLKQMISNNANDKFIDFWVDPVSCGVYLKWINPLGGYSYWLFNDTYAIDSSTKQIGELENDFSNLAETFSRVKQIGKETTDTIKLTTNPLTVDETNIVKTIINSPKIYLFTGQPFSQASKEDWMEITLKTSNVRVKNAKNDLTSFSLDFEKPMKYAQTL